MTHKHSSKSIFQGLKKQSKPQAQEDEKGPNKLKLPWLGHQPREVKAESWGMSQQTCFICLFHLIVSAVFRSLNRSLSSPNFDQIKIIKFFCLYLGICGHLHFIGLGMWHQKFEVFGICIEFIPWQFPSLWSRLWLLVGYEQKILCRY